MVSWVQTWMTWTTTSHNWTQVRTGGRMGRNAVGVKWQHLLWLLCVAFYVVHLTPTDNAAARLANEWGAKWRIASSYALVMFGGLCICFVQQQAPDDVLHWDRVLSAQRLAPSCSRSGFWPHAS